MAESSLTPAIIALVGVLVGSAVSGGSTYLIEQQREKVAAAESRGKLVREARSASRLIGHELAVDLEILHQTPSGRPIGPAAESRIEAWDRYSTVLASVMPIGEFSALSNAYVGIETIKLAQQMTPPLMNVDALKDTIADIKKALTVLQPYFDETKRMGIEKQL